MSLSGVSWGAFTLADRTLELLGILASLGNGVHLPVEFGEQSEHILCHALAEVAVVARNLLPSEASKVVARPLAEVSRKGAYARSIGLSAWSR